MIRVMLVDDHQIVRMGLKMLIETMDDYEVVCEAEDGLEALDCLLKQEIDLLLLDLNMPVMDGLSFLKKYQEQGGKVPVVILTTLDDQEKIKQGIAYGAKSYMLKDASRETLIRTMKAALEGEMLMTSEVMAKLMTPSQVQEDPHSPVEDFGLSEKETFVLTAVVNGDSNRAIAIDMGISERTVKAHMTSIFRKMDVASRAEAVAKYMKR